MILFAIHEYMLAITSADNPHVPLFPPVMFLYYSVLFGMILSNFIKSHALRFVLKIKIT